MSHSLKKNKADVASTTVVVGRRGTHLNDREALRLSCRGVFQDQGLASVQQREIYFSHVSSSRDFNNISNSSAAAHDVGELLGGFEEDSTGVVDEIVVTSSAAAIGDVFCDPGALGDALSVALEHTTEFSVGSERKLRMDASRFSPVLASASTSASAVASMEAKSDWVGSVCDWLFVFVRWLGGGVLGLDVRWQSVGDGGVLGLDRHTTTSAPSVGSDTYNRHDVAV